MKKLFVVGLILLALIFGVYSSLSRHKSNKKVVAAVFPVTVDAFTQFQNRARTVFEKQDIEFYIFSAEGDASRFHTIVDAAMLRNPDVLILVGTQLTNIGLGTRYENRKQKVIASCISDVSKVEALTSIGIDPPRKKNVAILSDMPKENAYEQAAAAISVILPSVKKIAILYNKSEINSENTATSLSAALKAKGKIIIDAIVSGEENVPRIATNAIQRGAELLVIPHDKYVIKHAVTISKIGMESSPKFLYSLLMMEQLNTMALLLGSPWIMALSVNLQLTPRFQSLTVKNQKI